MNKEKSTQIVEDFIKKITDPTIQEALESCKLCFRTEQEKALESVKKHIDSKFRSQEDDFSFACGKVDWI